MFVHFLSILLLVVGSSAQTKYCCTPPKWQSTLDVISGGMVDGKTYFVKQNQNVTVDSTTHMVSRIMYEYKDGQTSKVNVIQDFDKRIEYRIANGVCRKTDLEAWTPKCIPDDARPLLTSYFGTGDKKVDFTSYYFTQDGDDIVMDVSNADCTPLIIALTSYDKAGVPTGYTIGTYGNFTIGIQDPTVFNVPTISTGYTIGSYGNFAMGIQDSSVFNVPTISTGYTIGSYGNFMMGIRDSSVFNVPAICNS